jgi:hypothetical protein
MKLPVIRSITEYIEQHDISDVEKTLDVLEHVSQVRGLKDEERDTIGELMSNLSGAMEVSQMVQLGTPKTEALNTFMKRVLGSIDKGE